MSEIVLRYLEDIINKYVTEAQHDTCQWTRSVFADIPNSETRERQTRPRPLLKTTSIRSFMPAKRLNMSHRQCSVLPVDWEHTVATSNSTAVLTTLAAYPPPMGACWCTSPDRSAACPHTVRWTCLDTWRTA